MLNFLQDNQDINITVRISHIVTDKLTKLCKINPSLPLKEMWIEKDYTRIFHLTFLRFKVGKLSNEENQHVQKNCYNVNLISTST